MDANSFDPAATLSPDDPLQEWLKDPAMAEFVKQKALEHAKSVLGYADGMDASNSPGTPPGRLHAKPGVYTGVNGPDADTPEQIAAGNPPAPTVPAAPTQYGGPTSIFGRMGLLPAGQSADPTAAEGPYVIDKGPATGPVPGGTSTPSYPAPVPLPAADPRKFASNPLDPEESSPTVLTPNTPTAPVASDVSARKKGDLEGASNDFAKTLAGLKPMAPPPLNAVGTPSVRSPLAISAPQVQQLLALLGAQSKPDPVSTLGRLLVAGKA